MINFNGKKVLVTGGTRGIGKAISETLASNNCEVLITGKRVKYTPAKSNIQYKHLNLLADSSVEDFISERNNINVDILVNNAGINIIQNIDVLDYESWESVIKVNLTGPMKMVKAIVPFMKDKKYGKIVNVSSIWGVVGKEWRHSYSSSKTGLIGLTRTLALDLAQYNILVNAICPGFTMTELTRDSLTDEEMKSLMCEVPLRRFASVSEIANVVAFLVSDLNTYVTGQTIVVDGGFTIR